VPLLLRRRLATTRSVATPRDCVIASYENRIPVPRFHRLLLPPWGRRHPTLYVSSAPSQTLAEAPPPPSTTRPASTATTSRLLREGWRATTMPSRPPRLTTWPGYSRSRVGSGWDGVDRAVLQAGRAVCVPVGSRPGRAATKPPLASTAGSASHECRWATVRVAVRSAVQSRAPPGRNRHRQAPHMRSSKERLSKGHPSASVSVDKKIY